MRNLKYLSAIMIALVIPNTLFAANHYIRADANGNGSSWSNAWPDLPTTFVRGDTYYVADGTYGGHTMDQASDGTKKITIKKATSSDHGTETGWDSAYGDGQAVFNGNFTFDTHYWVIDGQTRNENDWTDGGAYGFKVYYEEAKIFRTVYRGGAPSNVEVAYVYVQGKDWGEAHGNGMFYLPYAGSYWHVHHCFLYDINSAFFYFKNDADNATIEYNYIWKNQSYPTAHSEAIQMIGDVNDVEDGIVRYNVFREIEGTCVIAVNNGVGWEIYGNVFYDNIAGGNGVIGIGSSKYTSSNFKIYNNSFIDSRCQFSNAYAPTNWEVYNNILFNCSHGPSFNTGVSHDYNASDASLSETHAQTGITSAIFTNYSGLDFTLSEATDDGDHFNSPYAEDMYGNTRGVDGVWDRGAYEYGGRGSIKKIITSPTAPISPKNVKVFKVQ